MELKLHLYDIYKERMHNQNGIVQVNPLKQKETMNQKVSEVGSQCAMAREENTETTSKKARKSYEISTIESN